jgi:methionine-rich copper-binding protein CopC
MSAIPPNLVPRRTWRCPDEARLAAYFERRLPAPQQQEVEAHVSSCEHCLAQVAFLLEAEDVELPEVPRALLERARQPASRGTTFSGMVWKWSPAIAVLAGVVVVASILVWRNQPAPGVQPGRVAHREQAPEPAVATPAPQVTAELKVGSQTQESRGQTPPSLEPQVLEPKPSATVHAASLELRWVGVPQALFYEVLITNPSGQLIWSSKVEQERVRVPAEARLQPGSYFVWVRAHLPEGKVIRGQAVTFTVR